MKTAQIVIFTLATLLFVVLTTTSPISSATKPGTISTQPDNLSIPKGREFVVEYIIDTGNLDINTISLYINYPANKLEFIESSFSSSSFPNVVEKITNIYGVLRYTTYALPSYSGPNGLILKIKFLAKEIGEAKVTIVPSSNVYLADGKGTDVSDSFNFLSGTYTITSESAGSQETSKVYNEISFNNNDPQITDYTIAVKQKNESKSVSYNTLTSSDEIGNDQPSLPVLLKIKNVFISIFQAIFKLFK